MIEVIGVLCLCYLLIGLEAIVPGGVLGVLGFLGLFFAAYFSHFSTGRPWGIDIGFYGI
jgi:hypothetical protein